MIHMTFNSILFIILFPASVAVYRLLPSAFRYIWLLLCSLAFYIALGGSFVTLLIISSVITYLAGLAVDKADNITLKKAIMTAAVVVMILILFVFKYLDFSLELFGSHLRFNLILPVGISFYTFRAVSYMADVYNKKMPAEKNLLKLTLYLSFFLTIISGPITRANDLILQFTDAPSPTYDMTKRGMQKMLWGYFLKLAVAGRLAIVVENVYGDSESYSGFAVAICAIAYLFMLYCDFEGYSQIAIGGANLLGISMKENFSQPFFSKSCGELWRRWHVSLSSWFRDYLYIPLGGNRKGVLRKYINIFIVLLVSGIWHGANLTFFVWGALNGIFIIAGQILLPYRDALYEKIKGRFSAYEKAAFMLDRARSFCISAGVYILTAYTFIWFANKDIKSAYLAVKRIFTAFLEKGSITDVTQLGLGRANLALTVLMAIFVLVADSRAYKRKCDTPALITNIPKAARWAIYYALLIVILFSANLTGQEFIYANM